MGRAWLLILALAGCTSYTQEVAEPPPSPPQVMAVGRIEPERGEWERAALRFERSLVGALRASKAFALVRSSVPDQVPGDWLVVDGRMLDADDGSDFYQLFLGEWLAGPAAKVEVRVRGADGRVLLAFTDKVLISSRSVDPFASDPPEVKPLIDQLAADAAQAIVGWVAGTPVSDTRF